MKLGVALPIVDIGGEPGTIRDFVQSAEAIGYQGIALPDHVLGANPASRLAFFLSTTALSLLPLGLFGAGFLWFRARIRERFADEFTEREGVTPAVDSPAASRPATTGPHAG